MKIPQMKTIPIEKKYCEAKEPMSVVGFWVCKHDPLGHGGYSHGVVYRMSVAALVTSSGLTYIGVSVCNLDSDRFNKAKGMALAEMRACRAAKATLEGCPTPNTYMVDAIVTEGNTELNIMAAINAAIAAERRRCMDHIGKPGKMYQRSHRARPAQAAANQ